MSLADFQLCECGFHAGAVPDDTTVTINCVPGGVTGRYLVVQLNGNNVLTLCEVTAVGKRAGEMLIWQSNETL